LLPPREEDISKRKAKKTSHADMMVVNMCLLTHSLTHSHTCTRALMSRLYSIRQSSRHDTARYDTTRQEE
jgi:hypothetical protein